MIKGDHPGQASTFNAVPLMWGLSHLFVIIIIIITFLAIGASTQANDKINDVEIVVL